jgi:uncharacterized protein
MQGLLFPAVTAATAGALGLLQVALMLLVGAGRLKYKTGLGDGGHDGLNRRIRMHANLTENAPLFLILLGLVEVSGIAPLVVLIVGPLVVVLRLVHAYGLSMAFGPGPNPFRAVGAGGTTLSIVLLAVLAIVAALRHLG